MKKFMTKTKNVFGFVIMAFLLIASFCYAMFQGGFVSWFIFTSFLPLGLYTIALYFYRVHHFQVERIIDQLEFTAGEDVEVTINIKRKGFFPLFYLIVEDVIPELERKLEQPNKSIIYPLFKNNITYKYTIHNIPRGEYEFQQIKYKYGDLFGFIQKEGSFSTQKKILVFPNVTELNYEPFENLFELGMTATRDKVQRDSTMAISIREYEPGDRFSWINWKATARTNEIMTKEFEQSQTNDIMIVLDRSPHPYFEIAVKFLASMVSAILRKGAEVGLYSFGAKREYFPVQRGEFQQRTLFYHLAKVEDDAEVNLSTILDSEKLSLNQNRTTLLIINSADQHLIEKLTYLSRKKGQFYIFLMKGKGEKLTTVEHSFLELARKRGIPSKPIFDGEFVNAFSKGGW